MTQSVTIKLLSLRKKVLRKIVFLVFLFVLPASLSAAEPLNVSLIQLIATPEDFNGKKVRVSGFLHVKFEDSVLYLSKDHADHIMGRNGLWIDYSQNIDTFPEDIEDIIYFDGKAVTLEGIFIFEDEMGHGHFGLNSGMISETDRIIELNKYYDGGIELER